MRQRIRSRVKVSAVFGNIGGRALCLIGGPILYVLRNGDVRDAAACERRLDGFVQDIVDVRGPHHALVIDRDIHKKFIQVNVLLVMRADHIVKGVSRNGEDGLAVTLGVVESVQEVYASGAGSGKTDAQASSVFGITAGCKSGSFFMTHLNKLYFVLPRSQGFKNSVHAVAWKSEDRIHAPVDEPLDQNIGHSLSHLSLSSIIQVAL